MDVGNGKSHVSMSVNGETFTDTPDIEPTDLMKYLPDYYQTIDHMQKLQGTLGEELGNLSYLTDDILHQFFVSTATWGLSHWESELGMTIDPAKPVERRREQIMAKLRGAGTTTKQMIQNAAIAFSGGEVDVIEYPAEYRFVVKFVGVKGIPPNMPGFIQMLEQIKPAHLAYSFEYTYSTWDMVSDLNWSEAGMKTWDELKTYEGA
jgi:hypothetical protein